MTLLEAAKRANALITEIHRAFGSPGDYGYATAEGKSLYDLYRFQIELRAAIDDGEQVALTQG